MSVQYSTVQHSMYSVDHPHRPLCTVNDDIYDDGMIFIYGRAVVDL